MAIGCWQLARVYALCGDASKAIQYALDGVSLAREHSLAPFYLGYAWESAARAYFLAGMTSKAEDALRKAQNAASRVKDLADKAALELDLYNIRSLDEAANVVSSL